MVFPLKGKKASALTSEILKKLKSDRLDIMMCRSYGYDNAATRTGVHGGAQALIKGKNKKTVFNGFVDRSYLWSAFVYPKCALRAFLWNFGGFVFFLCCFHTSLGCADRKNRYVSVNLLFTTSLFSATR